MTVRGGNRFAPAPPARFPRGLAAGMGRRSRGPFT